MGAHAIDAAWRPLLLELQVPSRPAYDARVGGRILRAVSLRLARKTHSTVGSGSAGCHLEIIRVEEFLRALVTACVALHLFVFGQTCATLPGQAVEMIRGRLFLAAHASMARLAA